MWGGGGGGGGGGGRRGGRGGGGGDWGEGTSGCYAWGVSMAGKGGIECTPYSSLSLPPHPPRAPPPLAAALSRSTDTSAVNDLPALRVEVEELREEVARMQQAGRGLEEEKRDLARRFFDLESELEVGGDGGLNGLLMWFRMLACRSRAPHVGLPIACTTCCPVPLAS